MNLQTATIYAQQGYSIYRNPAWVDTKTNEVEQFIRSDGHSFYDQDLCYAVLGVEDCLADDWAIVRE